MGSTLPSTGVEIIPSTRYQRIWEKLGPAVNPGLTIKRYPCCGGNLRALDAAKGLIEENNISANDVETLTVDVHPDLLDIVRFHKPTVGFRGKFSIDYVLAAMLLDHKVDLNSFSDEYCNAPRMRETLNKVLVNAHEEWADDAASETKIPCYYSNEGR